MRPIAPDLAIRRGPVGIRRAGLRISRCSWSFGLARLLGILPRLVLARRRAGRIIFRIRISRCGVGRRIGRSRSAWPAGRSGSCRRARSSAAGSSRNLRHQRPHLIHRTRRKFGSGHAIQHQSTSGCRYKNASSNRFHNISPFCFMYAGQASLPSPSRAGPARPTSPVPAPRSVNVVSGGGKGRPNSSKSVTRSRHLPAAVPPVVLPPSPLCASIAPL